MSESKGAVEGITAHGPGCWWVYILLCRDGAYYVGATNDLARRCGEHFAGRGGHYTRRNPPIPLVHSEQFPSRQHAEARERHLEGWSPRKKEPQIAGNLALLKRV